MQQENRRDIPEMRLTMSLAELTMEQIYQTYYDRILRYIQTKLSSPQEAEDICSAVMLKIMNGLPNFQPSKSSLTTWIYTITRNAVTDHFRGIRLNAPLEETISFHEEGFDRILREETLEELAAALEALPQRERDVILLHYYSGRSLKEIAAAMGMSYSNIKLVHSKALAHLRKHLVLPE